MAERRARPAMHSSRSGRSSAPRCSRASPSF